MVEDGAGTLLRDWAVRLVSLAYLLVVFGMRGAVTNPLMTYVLERSWLDRIVAKYRPVINWGVFIGMPAEFIDVRITVRQRSGATRTWYVVRDGVIGPVRIHARPFRTGLALFTSLSQVPARAIADYVLEGYAASKDPLVELVVARESFAGDAPQDAIVARANPLHATTLVHEVREVAEADVVTDPRP